MTTISAHTYDALREKYDELRAENARLRAALAAAPRWVSVTERLPEDWTDARVLFADGSQDDAFYNEGVWYDHGRFLHTVTHWLELPPAPEVEP